MEVPGDLTQILPRYPGRPLVSDYRRIGLEHFFIGGFATFRRKAQHAIYG